MSTAGLRLYGLSRRAWFGAVLTSAMLCACAPFKTPGEGIYRDTRVPIGATTRFNAARFSGEWVIVAGFGPVPEGRMSFAWKPSASTLLLSSEVLPEYAGSYDVTRAGILQNLADNHEKLVVMWVDQDFRTATLGTEAGDFAVILNRRGNISVDRMTAARDILDFYGWDLSQLQGTQL